MGLNYINRNLEEFNNFLYNRKVAIIGLNKSSIPIIDYLHRHNAKISVFDERPLDELNIGIVNQIINYNMSYSLGELSLSKLKDTNLIIKSPEYRYDLNEIKTLVDRGAILTSVDELLIKLCPGKVIGIVGNYDDNMINLLQDILNNSGYNCYLDDNPYKPLLPRSNEMDTKSVLILQLSDKQLLGMDYYPDILTIVSAKNNYESPFLSYNEYIDTLKNLTLNQSKQGKLVLNYDDDIVRNFMTHSSNTILYSTSIKLDNGIMFDNDTIKLCNDGLRKHFLTIDNKVKKRYNYIANICACIASTLPLNIYETESARMLPLISSKNN